MENQKTRVDDGSFYGDSDGSWDWTGATKARAPTALEETRRQGGRRAGDEEGQSGEPGSGSRAWSRSETMGADISLSRGEGLVEQRTAKESRPGRHMRQKKRHCLHSIPYA